MSIRALLKGPSSWIKLVSTLEISGTIFQPLWFDDFDSHEACPLGRLGASRPLAAGDGIPAETGPGGDLRNPSIRCQDVRLAG